MTRSISIDDTTKFAQSQSAEILYKKTSSFSVAEITTRRIEISRHPTNQDPHIKEETKLDEDEERKTNEDKQDETALTVYLL